MRVVVVGVDGEVDIFDSAESAARYLEPYDILNGEVDLVVDKTMRRYSVTVDPQVRSGVRGLRSAGGRVRVTVAGELSSEETSRLKDRLIRYLQYPQVRMMFVRQGIDADRIMTDADVRELVESFCRAGPHTR